WWFWSIWSRGNRPQISCAAWRDRPGRGPASPPRPDCGRGGMLEQLVARAGFPDHAGTRLKEEYFRAQKGIFVDVGANDPKDISQTWHLEQMGWTGVLIEPQPDLAQKLREQRHARVFACACSSPENAGKVLPFQVSGIHSSLNLDLFVAGM